MTQTVGPSFAAKKPIESCTSCAMATCPSVFTCISDWLQNKNRWPLLGSSWSRSRTSPCNPFKALSHIRGSNRQIDPGRRSDSKHGSPYTLSNTAMRACNVAASNPGRTSTLRPRPQYHLDRVGLWDCLLIQLYRNQSRSLPRTSLSTFQVPPQRSGR